MGGSSSKSDMAAPVIVRETEKHLATVGAFHSFFSHFILGSYCTDEFTYHMNFHVHRHLAIVYVLSNTRGYHWGTSEMGIP